MPIDPERPIVDSYWVVPGRLLAGEYPGDLDAERARPAQGFAHAANHADDVHRPHRPQAVGEGRGGHPRPG